MPDGTPDIALSVRQPWAWAIIHAGKDVENRGWKACHRRGRVAIHAALGMTREEYHAARAFMAGIGVACPAPADLPRGCIVGSVEITGTVTESENDWFMGPLGLTLANPRPIEPMGRVTGALGFFRWRETDDPLPAPARWMWARERQARLL